MVCLTGVWKYKTFTFSSKMSSKPLVLLLIFCILISASCAFFTQNISSELEMARKKHKHHGGKYTLPILLGALMIKSIIFPLAFKAMAVMSSIAVMISVLSLIISSIVGYVKTVSKSTTPSVKFVQKPYGNWAKDDSNALKNYYTTGDNHNWPQSQFK